MPDTHLGLLDLDPYETPPRPQPMRGRLLPAISETLEVIALAIIMFIGVRAVGQNFVIDGSSMTPTFADGQLVIVNRLAYRTFDLSWLPGVDEETWSPFGEPAAGDVVVFHHTADREFIKRVIATEGQTVEVKQGWVEVDGVRLDESYIAKPARHAIAPATVPPDHVWVMGDNRNNSFDSRNWGPLPISEIVGRVDLRYWPAGDFGFIDKMQPIPRPVAAAPGN